MENFSDSAGFLLKPNLGRGRGGGWCKGRTTPKVRLYAGTQSDSSPVKAHFCLSTNNFHFSVFNSSIFLISDLQKIVFISKA